MAIAMNESDKGLQPGEGNLLSRVLLRHGSLLVLLLIASLITALVIGYGLFRAEIARYETQPVTQLTNAKGIVALTGDSNRIRTALDLFDRGIGERVLISGVNERTSKQALLRAANYKASPKPCCVDIGHIARDTRGNGIETAHWVRQQNYKRVIVVTSDYHMPRSLLELSHAMPDVELIPVAASVDPSRAFTLGVEDETVYQRSNWVRHSLKEYGKYLVAYGRILLEDSTSDMPVFARMF